MKKHAATILFACLALAGVWQFFLFWPALPARVVTQQTMTGAPATEIARVAVAGLYFLILLGFAAYFVVAGMLLKRLPDRFFKALPNRDHWLAPERRAETVESLCAHLLWLGVATLSLFLLTFLCIFLVNTGRTDMSLDLSSNVLTTFYLGYIFFGLLALRNRFRLPGQERGKPRAS